MARLRSTADVDGLIVGDVVPGSVAESAADLDKDVVTRVAGPSVTSCRRER